MRKKILKVQQNNFEQIQSSNVIYRNTDVDDASSRVIITLSNHSKTEFEGIAITGVIYI